MDPTDVYLNVLIPHTSLVATAFSSGGGSKQSINGGGLAGRASGGGTRNEIYGTARYGSGYGQYTTSADGTTQYQPDFTLDVSRRDFPHGFPPLSFGNYSGGGEYYSVEQGDLPGVLAPHHCATATIGSCDARVFALDISVGDQTWYVLADYVTVETINAIVSLPVAQGGCNMIGRIPQAMARGSTYGSQNETAPIGDKETQGYSTARATGLGIIRLDLYPWNVLQFYRGSSVAFISPDYDNAFAHNGNNNTDYWASTPFNKTGVDIPFLDCLNHTIAAAIPIVDPTLIVRSRLSKGQIAGIVVGSVAGVVLIAVGIWFWHSRQKKAKQAY